MLSIAIISKFSVTTPSKTRSGNPQVAIEGHGSRILKRSCGYESPRRSCAYELSAECIFESRYSRLRRT
jgi:hypothetical protein